MSNKNLTGSLSIDHISMIFGVTKVLDEVSVEFRPGNIYGVVGHNGAGKSTLMQILSGALRPTEGDISLGEQKLEFNTPQDALLAGIACVYQELSLPLNLPIYQCLYLAHEFRKGPFVDKRRMREESKKLCALVGLNIDVNLVLGTLPVSQRQLLEIAAALGRNAKALLLDEPTTALEPSQVEVLFNIIRKLADEQNLIVLLVNHKLDEILSVCDHVTALAEGAVILSSKTSETNLAQLTEAIIGTNLKSTNVAVNGDGTNRSIEKSVSYIEANNIKAPGLHDVSFSVNQGEILGIYGLNGSGRTRLLRVLYGDLEIESGQLRIDGADITFKDPRDAFRQGVAYLSEERKRDGFFPLMNAAENVTLPILWKFREFMIFLNRKSLQRFSEKSLLDLSVKGNLKGPISRLSGGNQQKVLFAKVLAQKPRILLLDEPTKGVDIGAKREIYRIIKDAAENENVTILVVSSEEEEILALSDSVLVMKLGNVLGDKLRAEGLSLTDLRRAALNT